MATIERPQVHTLSDLLSDISQFYQQIFPQPIWIVAEIAELRRASKGHCYLSLVEYENRREKAKCNAMIWAQQFKQLDSYFSRETGQTLSKGMKVMVYVRPTFHQQFGMSLTITQINTSFTLGEMQKKNEAILKKLQENGFRENLKQLPSREYTRVAVLSPSGAAGLDDFNQEAQLLQSYGLCEFVYFHATFQGANTVKEMQSALQKIRQSHLDKAFDACVIIRGGGAVADLAWLNDYDLAYDTWQMPMPVYTGIGHERDTCILDIVSSVRFDTPSKVSLHIASVIVGNMDRAAAAMGKVKVAAERQVQRIHYQAVSLLNSCKQQATLSVNRIEVLANQSIMNIAYRASSGTDKIQNKAKLLYAGIISFDVRKTLERGYVIVRDGDTHKPITRASEMTSSARLEFFDNTVQVTHDE